MGGATEARACFYGRVHAPGRHASADGGNPWRGGGSAFRPVVVLTPIPGASLRRDTGLLGSDRLRVRGRQGPDRLRVGNVWACREFDCRALGGGEVEQERSDTRRVDATCPKSARYTSSDGDSGTDLSMGAEDDGDRWCGVPRVHPSSSCESNPTRSDLGRVPSLATKSTGNRVGTRCHWSVRVICGHRMR
jgi:hypothetical protein